MKQAHPFGSVGFCLCWLAACCFTPLAQGDISSGAGRLNDTGIGLCADYAYGNASGKHNNDIQCSLLSDADGDRVPRGQDGHYGRDINNIADDDGHAGFSFTKISALGQALPVSATAWGCIRDNVTGLVWEVKTTDDGLHDWRWTYTWHETDAARNGGDSGVQDGGSCGITSFCDTYAYVQMVNSHGWCGARDWRLPTREELRSLVDLSYTASPTLDVAQFPNTQSKSFWSSSLTAYDKSLAWSISFSDGSDYLWFKGDSLPVRLVRGGVLSISGSRFVDNHDGTVTDNQTGLMWKKCAEGQVWNSAINTCGGTAAEYEWWAIFRVAEFVNANLFVGKDGWRVPNLKELASIVETQRRDPAINLALFPKMGNDEFWSSSPAVSGGDGHFAWGVEFREGSDFWDNKDDTYHVRLVRDAQ